MTDLTTQIEQAAPDNEGVWTAKEAEYALIDIVLSVASICDNNIEHIHTHPEVETALSRAAICRARGL